MDKRGALTLAVCVGFFVLWMTVISPLIWPPPKRPPPGTRPPNQTQSAPPPSSSAELKPQASAHMEGEEPRSLTSKHLQVTLSNYGASIQSLAVLYPESRPNPLIERLEQRQNSFLIRGLEKLWKIEHADTTSASFSAERDGLLYTLTYSLKTEGYVLRAELTVQNLTDKSIKLPSLEILALNGMREDRDAEQRPYRYEQYQTGYFGYRQGDLFFTYQNGAGKYDKDEKRVVGLKNRYFALAVIPEHSDEFAAFEIQPFSKDEIAPTADRFSPTGYKNLRALLVTRERTVQKSEHPGKPGPSEQLTFEIYAGPIKSAELAAAPEDLHNLLSYTGFNIIGMAILAALNFFYSILGNYGIAIVLTTLTIRLCLFPINLKSQVSMFRMQQLAPKAELLKARHKNDPQKAMQETMALYREHKISPMSGCLGLLVQLPIFMGMYSVLDISIDLRQSPFFGWIHDLSQPDRLIDFGHNIPLLLFSFDALNVMPIIMTITWFLQGLMQPKSQDPNMQMQQKIFMFMPIMFGLISYSLASGLSWYFFINSLLSMGETKLIKKKFLKPIPVS